MNEMTINGTAYRVGDVVTVGRGRSEWIVKEFWFSAQGTPMVALAAVEGFANTSVDIARLSARVVTA